MIYSDEKNKNLDTDNYINSIDKYLKELILKYQKEKTSFVQDEKELSMLFDEAKSAVQDILDDAEKKSNEIILNAKIQADIILSTAIELSCKTLRCNEV